MAWKNRTKIAYDICSCCRHLGFIQTHVGILPAVIVPVFVEFTVTSIKNVTFPTVMMRNGIIE